MQADMMDHDASTFHPLVTEWFTHTYGTPTDIQARTWEAVARGGHVLMTAPTGSGKTMAAFLWALDQLIRGHWSGGCVRVLYVSPLNALNNDIQRNLLAPLAQLRALFETRGQTFPRIRVRIRSGDTPPSERRRMIRRPPEVLITTPESLNLLLSSAGGRSMLGAVETVILDEIHAVINSRRGTFLITAVERLTLLSGEFQRIALSATMQPLDAAARFVGGFRMQADPVRPHYVPRPVKILRTSEEKKYHVQVCLPEQPETVGDPAEFWQPYAERFRERIRTNRSTLLFTNSRRLCEKLTYLINRQEGGLLAYSHHGSLSKTIRREVEQHLKAGDLKAIVATNSLELGIDIGALDEVILVQSPVSVSAAVQRIGRAGHGVGETSRGLFFPSHTMDIVAAAVLVSAIRAEAIEPLQPLAAPLDVLAQVLLSMLAFDSWAPDDLYNRIRCAAPYRELSRTQFDRVVDLLAGRFAGLRIRELQSRIYHDGVDNRLKAKKGALLTLYTSGGVIPDRGYYGLRHSESGARIGELDEEFVWEARIGQVFTLGTQNWRIQKITASDVLVSPAPRSQPAPPFWRAEENSRGFHLSEKIARFMERADERLRDPSFDAELQQVHGMDTHASDVFRTFLLRQTEQTGCSLPHRHHLVVESTVMAGTGGAGRQVVLHTLWGGRINRPLAIAMEAAWRRRFGTALEIFPSNDAIAVILPRDISGEELLELVRADRLDEFLHEGLAQTGFFGARFRECAGRALLLPRRSVHMRMPLWLSRLKAQKLMTAVADQAEFPILAETWRTCLQDEFELPQLRRLLAELEKGEIAWSYVRTRFPSPLAQIGAWQQVNHFMYQLDQPAPPQKGQLSADLFREVALEPGLRPRIASEVVQRFETKRQRLTPGYAPDCGDELLDWVKERLAVPFSEWEELITAMARDQGSDVGILIEPVAAKLVRLQGPANGSGGQGQSLVVARELLPVLMNGLFSEAQNPLAADLLSGEPLDLDDQSGRVVSPHDNGEPSGADLLGQWLAFYGPRTARFISERLLLPLEQVGLLLDELIQTGTLITGELSAEGDDVQFCDRENFEILLRMSRHSAVPDVQALLVEYLPLFLGLYQGFTHTGSSAEVLPQCLNQLLCWAAPAPIWETDLLPARLEGYRPEWIDDLIQAEPLRWIGRSDRSVFFCFEHEMDLIQADHGPSDSDALEQNASQPSPGIERFFAVPGARYPFEVLQENSQIDSRHLSEQLWQAVWKGTLTNDTFTALRRGIETGYKVSAFRAPTSGRAALGRGRRLSGSIFQRWRGSRPNMGNWFRPPEVLLPEDALEIEERNKERARLLLDRYGILFRELLVREMPVLQWRAVFRSLRLMELSGEVLSGHFFSGVAGIQFIAPQALEMLRRGLSGDAVFWINAVDPASVCGLGLEAFAGQLPKRLPGNHLVYHGSRLVVVSLQHARRLRIAASADDRNIKRYFSFLRYFLVRPVRPLSCIIMETINDQPAVFREDYLVVLREMFETVVDPKGVTLYRKYG
jgi:ATP-dependent Lhr-like helicase